MHFQLKVLLTGMTAEHSLFPVQMIATWQAPSAVAIESKLRDWLLDPASLTARLKLHCQVFRVEVTRAKN